MVGRAEPFFAIFSQAPAAAGCASIQAAKAAADSNSSRGRSAATGLVSQAAVPGRGLVADQQLMSGHTGSDDRDCGRRHRPDLRAADADPGIFWIRLLIFGLERTIVKIALPSI